ncbi:MAG: undecaprenyl-diphosphate phosphatase [Luteibaculum sp.]
MTWVEALILGLIQGLTEYLPVSSSGHLEIAREILGGNSLPEENLWFTVWVHFATALSTVVVYRKRIAEIFTGLFSRKPEEWRFAAMIVLSMIPAGLVGLFFEDAIDNLFVGNLVLVGCSLFGTALLLLLADFYNGTDIKITPSKAIWMGLAQAVAILPGISRSGATIAAGIMVKTDKGKAAEFSFLMVIPLIFGKMAKDLLDAPNLENIASGPILLGFVAAFVAGILACTFMIRLVKASKLRYFSVYCAIAAVFCLLYSFI